MYEIKRKYSPKPKWQNTPALGAAELVEVLIWPHFARNSAEEQVAAIEAGAHSLYDGEFIEIYYPTEKLGQ